jgi:D-alanyl-D-alanine carboxypeptidase
LQEKKEIHMENTNKAPKKKKRPDLVPPRARVVIGLFLIIALIVCLNRPYHLLISKFVKTTVESDGNFADDNISEDGTEFESSVTPVGNDNKNINYLPAEYFETTSLSADQINNGDLVLVDSSHPYTGSTSDFISFDDDIVNHCYYIRSYSLSFQRKMLSSLNSLTKAYCDIFETADIFIYNTSVCDTTDYPMCPDIIAERATGYTLDIVMRNSDTSLSSIDDFTNDWITENCYKYGFVVRYENDKSDFTGVDGISYHLRYVGKVNSYIMHEKDYCLEEYLFNIKEYSYLSPLVYTIDDKNYEVYYVASTGDLTDVQVPKDDEKYNYYISGNNTDGFVVIVAL